MANCCFDLTQILFSFQALTGVEATKYKSFRKQAAAIKEIKYAWNAKMKELQEKGYSEKEIMNTKREAAKLADLEFIKSQEISGPFTSKSEIQDFVAKEDIPEVEKRNRLYREVRYARTTSLSLAPTAAVFRLRNGGKYLSIQEYADNLSQYLDDSKCVKSLTLIDLHEVLNLMQVKLTY